jgi:hypothetical protein
MIEIKIRAGGARHEIPKRDLVNFLTACRAGEQ